MGVKRVLLVIMITAALFSFAGCGRKKKAQEAYDAIGSMSISDESILTSEEQATIAGGITEAYYGVPEELKAKLSDYLDEQLMDIVRKFEELM